MENYIYRLAEIVDAIKYEKLPQDVTEKAKLCIIDDLECCMNSMNDERGIAALESIPKDRGNSTIFGMGYKADAADAAYVNTVKACIAVRNDTSKIAVCHPGNIIVAVVLALAEENHTSGRRIIEAVIAGYEAMIRFGIFLDGRLNPAWRYTAVFGPVGAAFAAAKVSGLTVEQTASAASFACHSCGGVNQWAISGTGDDVFQNSAGARNGIFSMRLAKNGAKACMSIIEGRTGIAAAFGIHDGYDILTKDYEDYMIHTIMHKPIRSCVFVQNPCQAACGLLKEHPEINAGRVERIEIYVNTAAYTLPGTTNNEKIETITNAVMSIPYGVANVIVNRSDENLSFAPPFDSQVLELMHKCQVFEDKHYPAAGPQASRVKVWTTGGHEYEYENPELIPLTREEVKELFLHTCSERIGEENAGRALGWIEQLEKLDDCHAFIDLLK